jgi:hypothetical protein
MGKPALIVEMPEPAERTAMIPPLVPLATPEGTAP